MLSNKQEELEQLRLETKIISLRRVKEALDNDEWSDVAKLGKDSYSAIVKEEGTISATTAMNLQMLSTLGRADAVEAVLARDMEIASVLSRKSLPAQKAK